MEIDLVWAAGTDLTLWYELIGRKGKVDLDGKEVVMEDGRRRRRRGRGRVMPASRTCYFSSVSNFQTKPNSPSDGKEQPTQVSRSRGLTEQTPKTQSNLFLGSWLPPDETSSNIV